MHLIHFAKLFLERLHQSKFWFQVQDSVSLLGLLDGSLMVLHSTKSHAAFRPVYTLPQLWAASLVWQREQEGTCCCWLRQGSAPASPASRWLPCGCPTLVLLTSKAWCKIQTHWCKSTYISLHPWVLVAFAASKAPLSKAINNEPWQQQYWTKADSWMSSYFPAMGISPCSALSQNVYIENKADYLNHSFIRDLLLMQANK